MAAIRLNMHTTLRVNLPRISWSLKRCLSFIVPLTSDDLRQITDRTRCFSRRIVASRAWPDTLKVQPTRGCHVQYLLLRVWAANWVHVIPCFRPLGRAWEQRVGISFELLIVCTADFLLIGFLIILTVFETGEASMDFVAHCRDTNWAWCLLSSTPDGNCLSSEEELQINRSRKLR